MFDRIAHRYDLLNRLLSMGLDRRWRRVAIEALRIAPGDRVLDLATGTGDLALAIAVAGGPVDVLGVDPSAGMLAQARAKAARCPVGEGRLDFVLGDAQELDYPDASFDAIVMAFGIRNVADRQRALREMRRVLRPGGRLAILELTESKGKLLSPAARFWVRRVVPYLGGLISGQAEYRYLQRSIAAFPAAADFARMMEAADLRSISLRAFSLGVCHLFVAEGPSLSSETPEPSL